MRAWMGFFTAALALVGFSVAVMTADTWRERLHHHTLERERAHVYANSPHCRAASRSKLGDFHKCGEAEAILASPPPLWHATVDVAATLPPLLKQFSDGVRSDLHRVVLTLIVVVGVWVWARRFVGQGARVHRRRSWQQYPANSLPMFHYYSTALANAPKSKWHSDGPDIREMDY